jgi:hypothetical protein
VKSRWVLTDEDLRELLAVNAATVIASHVYPLTSSV